MQRNLKNLLIFGLATMTMAISFCSKSDNSEAAKQSAKIAAQAKEAAKKAEKSRLNVVLVSIDTLRRDHVTAYGYPKETTPFMEQLAKESVVFDTAITVQTNTAPSHATMLTGLFPGSHGILLNGMQLKKDIPTMATILKEAGYVTGGFVSGWSLSQHTELQRGFDEYNAVFSGSRRDGIVTYDLAKKWLKQQSKSGKPFFLFLHLFEPHFPYDPPAENALKFLPDQKKLLAPTERPGLLPGLKSQLKLSARDVQEYEARYDGEIVTCDGILETLISDIKRLKIKTKTIFVFLSDHGETLFEREWVADHGGRVYDEQLRVPLLIRFPNKAHGGVRFDQQVQLTDVLPTVLDYLNIAKPDKLEGRSLQPLINGKKREKKPRPAFSQARSEPVRVPEIQAALSKEGLISSIRLPTIKLIEYPMKDGDWYKQLFDLTTDPNERINIAKDRPDDVAKLHDQLSKWRTQTGVNQQGPLPELSKEVEKGLRALGYVR
jgi:arylsulfatase A-like enzyme